MMRMMLILLPLLFAASVAAQTDGIPTPAGDAPSLMTFGATCDGKADDSPAFAAAVKWMSGYPGRPVSLPLFRTCTVTRTIAISSDFAGFVCPAAGRSVAGIAGTPDNGCAVSWAGPEGGTLMSVVAPTGTPNAHALAGITVKGVSFLGNGKAGVGLELRSVRLADIDGNYFENFTTAALQIGTVSVKKRDEFNDNCDSDHLSIRNLSIDQKATKGTAIDISAFRNDSFYNGGCTLCLSRLRDIKILIRDGNGIVVAGADNNIFENVQIYRAKEGKGIGLDLTIHANNGLTAPAHSNLFLLYSSNAPTVARGKTSFPNCKEFSPAGMGNSSCTFGNSIIGLDTSNATPPPTVEPGASLRWTTDTGVQHDLSAAHLAIGENDVSASDMAAKMGNESLRIFNGSANHLILDDGNSQWAISEDDHHDFRIGMPNIRAVLSARKEDGVIEIPTLSPSSQICTDANRGLTTANCGTQALSGITEMIGGRTLPAGACDMGLVKLAGAKPGMGVIVTPTDYPGDGFWWEGLISAPEVVTVKICARVAGTPKASIFGVRVIR